jgi:phosphatidylglycerol:prolipoprotein diacylglycerol transferase
MLEALIPYIDVPSKTLVDDLPLLGPLKLQVFGPLVATGVILGYRQCLKFAKVKDMDEFLVRDLMFWILVAGFVMAHWVSAIFYFPDDVAENPWMLLAVWNGLSSVGGFLGAFIGMVWFLKKHRQPVIPFADLLIYGLLLGWCFGRLGCSLVHDHPGRIADPDAWLAVGPWPRDGNYRYDLGLCEWLFAVALTIYVYGFAKWKTWRAGKLTGLVATAYAPFRFGLDFLRAEDVRSADPRYAGLTTAQWMTFLFLAAGLWLLFFRKAKPSDTEYARDSDRIARERAAAEQEQSDDDDDDETEAPQGSGGDEKPPSTA